MLYDKGILTTNGFSIGAPKPADLKFVADTISDRDSYVTNNLAYEGMLVYVKEDQNTYQYKNNLWEEFGFNIEQFQSQVVDSLVSESTTKALSARQGKILNSTLTNHINDTSKHISSSERDTWNAKASTALVTQASNGLMSYIDKKKLDGIQTNANNYTHPDTHLASIIEVDSDHRFVTDDQINTWDSKAPNTLASTTSNGLMTSAMVTKLNSIATGANAYTHPATHDASIINTDSTHRFVTDIQISNWDNKASSILASGSNNGLMSKEDKIKLDTISENANYYIHPTKHDPSIIATDATHRFVTDEQINLWNSKPSEGDIPIVSHETNGLMLYSDKVKIDTIENGANYYTHPSKHPASIILQDTNNKFVTDEQINLWNSKAPNTLATTDSNGLMSSVDKSNLNTLIINVNNIQSQINTLSNRMQAAEEELARQLDKLKTAVFIE